jgi:hypothetical protein
MKRFVYMLFFLALIASFTSCATDESLFDDNYANDAFQKIIVEDGVTEDHIMEGTPMSPQSSPAPGSYPQNQQQ